ncbi:MAG: hypothetical protein ACRD3D_07635 [Terriglobia bacterium]
MARSRRIWFPLGILLLCGAAATLQSAPQEQATQPQGSSADHAKKKRKGVLGLVPTYGVTSDQASGPLTAREKFRLAVDGTANPFEVAEAAFKAEYYRGTNPRKKIGHGGTGYLKQWGASYLDEISGNMFNTFVYPALLHQDPRYFRQGEGSIRDRVAYSLSRVLVTSGDSGRREFNASMVLGSATSTALSNLYYPPRSRGVGMTIGNVGWALVGDGARNVFEEFWPDIAARLSRRR